MKATLFSILLFIGLYASAQVYVVTPVNAHSPILEEEGGCTTYYAESIWLFENDYTDEKSNHTLTPQGSPVFDLSPTPPEGSYSIDINASGRYLELESIDYGNEFTWIFEIYIGTSGSKTLVGAMPGDDGYRLSVDVTNDDIYLYTGNGVDTDYASAENVGLSDYTFMQVAVTVDRTAGTAAIYLDGSDVTSNSTIRTDFENTTDALLGSRQSIGSYIYGNIDAVQLYLWELTSTQIGNANTTPGEEQTKCE